eukprot:CAMPEP_0118907884 /NCGR_PEP_ID=MMETSP1166-20130328/11135_1 /TAXON_ID=1104430 /ORGANISM="Chrysoreinhardia sp, Strain CCMP3193" /LENGTH=337 /DNA_ID=CAMNT_0006847261 /DNA_START=27 /DNA_END=1040 /DNA_ORIENTATION=+
MSSSPPSGAQRKRRPKKYSLRVGGCREIRDAPSTYVLYPGTSLYYEIVVGFEASEWCVLRRFSEVRKFWESLRPTAAAVGAPLEAFPHQSAFMTGGGYTGNLYETNPTSQFAKDRVAVLNDLLEALASKVDTTGGSLLDLKAAKAFFEIDDSKKEASSGKKSKASFYSSPSSATSSLAKPPKPHLKENEPPSIAGSPSAVGVADDDKALDDDDKDDDAAAEKKDAATTPPTGLSSSSSSSEEKAEETTTTNHPEKVAVPPESSTTTTATATVDTTNRSRSATPPTTPALPSPSADMKQLPPVRRFTDDLLASLTRSTPTAFITVFVVVLATLYALNS